MFSTCMTAHDAVSRVSLDILGKMYPNNERFRHKSTFSITVLVMALINWIVISAFSGNMASLVALATFVSFVMAPLVGWMNLKTVTGGDIPQKDKPSTLLKILSYLGMVFLSAFAVYYCWILII